MADQSEIIAVADSSFLIGLTMINQLDLIAKLVDKLYIAPAVWEEIILPGEEKPGVNKIKNEKFIEKHLIQNRQAVEMLEVFLGAGESETLVLAQEMECSIIFIDDLRARKVAQKSGLRTMGVAGFLLTAKQKGLITKVKPLLNILQQKGFRLVFYQ